MKKSIPAYTLVVLVLLWSVFVITGCKKEAEVKPVLTAEPVSTNTGKIVPNAVDSSNYLKGTFGGEAVKFEGNAVAYNAYVNPDSNQNNGHGNGQGWPNYNAYYLSGSKWVSFTGNGGSIMATNASVELRSLAVRVFVTPLEAQSTLYYNLLNVASYGFADGDDTNAGAYVSIRDNSGVLWTSIGDQQGSTLTVTSLGANMNTYAVVSGVISCKMYDPQGNIKLLTGANFTAALGI